MPGLAAGAQLRDHARNPGSCAATKRSRSYATGRLWGTLGDMSLDAVTALFLIVVPILFNVAFFESGRAFDYPDISGASPTRSCGGSMPAAPASCSAGTCCS